jgi:hypothetical protein
MYPITNSFNSLFPTELPTSFIGRGEVKGYQFNQVRRSNEAYIFEVYDTFGNRWYEVFKRVIDTRFNKIAYPKSKSFGISAWTAKTLPIAEERFQLIATKKLVIE